MNFRNLRSRNYYRQRYELYPEINLHNIIVDNYILNSQPSVLTNNLNYNSNTPNNNYLIFTMSLDLNNSEPNNNINLNNELLSREQINNNILFPSVGLLQNIISNLLEENYFKKTLTENEYKSIITESFVKIEECPICMNSSEKKIKINNCNHEFCENCIKTWLLKNSITCPLCRTKLID